MTPEEHASMMASLDSATHEDLMRIALVLRSIARDVLERRAQAASAPVVQTQGAEQARLVQA